LSNHSLDGYLELANRVEFRDGKPYWKVRPNNRVNMLKPAGTLGFWGYRYIKQQGKRIAAHRLHWFMHYGSVPPQIDHINGVPDDNRIDNLRALNQAGNTQNTATPRNNTSGVKGVSHHRKSYRAEICLAGVRTIKLFKTLDAAVAWRKQKEIELHPYRPKEPR
jgi:HNH endonuclease